MIEFLVDGAWCAPDFSAKQAPNVTHRGDDYWRSNAWQWLGELVVAHPKHGSIKIAPVHFAWRIA